MVTEPFAIDPSPRVAVYLPRLAKQATGPTIFLPTPFMMCHLMYTLRVFYRPANARLQARWASADTSPLLARRPPSPAMLDTHPINLAGLDTVEYPPQFGEQP
jgi:hypothetical protein